MFDVFRSQVMSSTSNADIAALIRNFKTAYNKDIVLLSDQIKKDSCNRDSIIANATSHIDSAIFSGIVERDVSNELKSFDDATFLRDIDDDRFSFIVEYVITNAMLEINDRDDVISELDITREQFARLYKVLRYVLKCVVVQRFSKKMFSAQMILLFCFSEYKIDMLWELYTAKRSELEKMILLNMYETVDLLSSKVSTFIDVCNSEYDAPI